jgi:hypothetical protein
MLRETRTTPKSASAFKQISKSGKHNNEGG